MTAHLAGLVLAAVRGAGLDITLGEVLSAAIPTAVGVVVVALVKVTYARIEEAIRVLGTKFDGLQTELAAGKVADAEIRGRLGVIEREVEMLREAVEARRQWFPRRRKKE